jgi:protease I
MLVMGRLETMAALEGRRVAFLVANEGVEEVELTRPWAAVSDAGGEPVLLAPKGGTVQAYNHLTPGEGFAVDVPLADAELDAFDALVLPGGVANADALRLSHEAVRFVHEAADAGMPIAVICHGPWTMIDAGLVRDRTLTSWPSLRTDIMNAGGEWVDREVVVDRTDLNTIVSSRKPDDLPRFCEEMVKAFASAPAAAR